jgi:hypothetical protein
VKGKVIPVTRGETGTISKSLIQYLSNIPGKHEIKELQKTAILGTAHYVQRKVLMLKCKTYFTGRNNITCSTDCKYRTAATVCTIDSRDCEYTTVETLYRR